MKKLMKFIFVLGSAAVLSVACQKDEPAEVAELSVTPENVAAEAAGGQYTLSVVSNTSWTASTTDAWITSVSPESGEGEGEVVITVEPNIAAEGQRAEARQGEIVFSFGDQTLSVAVSQEPEELVFVALGETSDVSYKQTKVVVNVSHNVDYTVSIPTEATWITKDESPAVKAALNDAVVFTVAKNKGAARNATITFTPAQGEAKTVVINQAEYSGLAPEGALEGQFSVSATKKVFFSEGNIQTTLSFENPAFAANQYEFLGNNVEKTDLFAKDKLESVIPEGWSLLTNAEWVYLLTGRENARSKFRTAVVADIYGMIIMPDAFDKTIASSYSMTEWTAFESETDAVFIPAAGYCYGTAMAGCGEGGSYWCDGEMSVDFDAEFVYAGATAPEGIGQAIRPVKEVVEK